MGRPRAFATVEDLQRGIDSYLLTDDPKCFIGLAVHLGVSKDTVNAYGTGEYGEEFSVPIKRVVDTIEAQTVSGLLGGKLNPAGSIFVLCNNFDYQNKQYREGSGQTTQIIKLDAEAAKAVASELQTAITED